MTFGLERSSRSEPFETTTDGLSGRAALWAVTSPVETPLNAQRMLLRSCGLTGGQLADRLDNMAASGWKFDAVSSATEIATNNHLKLMSYLHELSSIWAHALGVRMDNPVKVATSYLAHEITHHDQSIRYPLTSYEDGCGVMGKRYVLSEARSYMTEAFTAQSLGVREDRVSEVVQALKSQDLGGLVYDTHHYSNFNDIWREDATDIVNEHVENYYHKPPVDTRSRMVAFDITRGNDDIIRPLELDHFYRTPADVKDLEWCRKMYRENRSCSFINFEESNSLIHSRWSRWAGKIGMLGAAVSVTDLAAAYGRGREEGNRRLGDFAIDCCGYEAGTAAGSRLANSLPLRLRIPIVIMCGIAGSTGFRAFVES